ncbi:hypothetical protein [Paenibacillus herberti]|uniref:Uncharacterized protein n=1 Tax=Paenibacillus herberti TaxID=1619309 RepID=A0A229P031_9BACL|nr:hypothetical protein [Paenibacillus herberti]OXM15447.1 hypothetical protein CGZ75_01520 [Paenibacillus herberti]
MNIDFNAEWDKMEKSVKEGVRQDLDSLQKSREVAEQQRQQRATDGKAAAERMNNRHKPAANALNPWGE